MGRFVFAVILVYLLGPFSAYSQLNPARVFNTSNSGLPSNNVRAVATDSSGDLWVGTLGGGLARFDGHNWTVYNTGNSMLPDNYVFAIAVDSSGREWIGTFDGLLCYDGGRWKLFNTDSSDLPDNYVTSIAMGPAGEKWIGTSRGGLAKLDGNKWTVYNMSDSGLPSDQIQSIAVSNKGDVLVGTPDGLAKFDGKDWTVYDKTNSGLPDDNVSAVAIGRRGRIWVGTSTGVFLLDGDKWTNFDTRDAGLPDNSVWSIVIDEEGNVWIATSRGLAKFDGSRWLVYDKKTAGVPDGSVVLVAADRDASMWTGTQAGLVEINYGLPERLLEARRLVNQNEIQEAMQKVKEFTQESKLDELGYMDKFLEDFQAMLNQRRTNSVDKVLNALARLKLSNIMATYINLANLFTTVDDSAIALGILNRVIANDPENKEARLTLVSGAYRSAQDFDEIIRDFRNAAPIESTRRLALAYEEKSMWSEANKVWRTIADSANSIAQVKEAENHIEKNIEKNTIALMTSNPPQVQPASKAVQQEEPRNQNLAQTTSDKPEVLHTSFGDVDSDVPRADERNPNAIALILAIPQYQSPEIPAVKFARHDAEVVRQYLIKALGFKPENILPMVPDEQLTYGRIQTYIKSILPSYLKPDGSSELFVYFTGHGAPSTITHEAYLVPWDGDPNYVSDNNSYSMKKFYVDLELLNARKKIIVIDACFSGMDGNGQSLIRYASPALLKINNPLIADPSTVIFQSSSANQVSNWYDAKRHGMFTYFFLKGLQGAADLNGDGKITADEVIRYVNNPDDGLPYYSNRLYQRPQEAQLEGNGDTIIERLAK